MSRPEGASCGRTSPIGPCRGTEPKWAARVRIRSPSSMAAVVHGRRSVTVPGGSGCWPDAGGRKGAISMVGCLAKGRRGTRVAAVRIGLLRSEQDRSKATRRLRKTDGGSTLRSTSGGCYRVTHREDCGEGALNMRGAKRRTASMGCAYVVVRSWESRLRGSAPPIRTSMGKSRAQPRGSFHWGMSDVGLVRTTGAALRPRADGKPKCDGADVLSQAKRPR